MTIRKRIPIWKGGKVEYFEGEICSVWGEELFKSMLWYKDEEIPFDHPRSPFKMILTYDKICDLPPELSYKRSLLPHEKELHPNLDEIIVRLDWLIKFKSTHLMLLKILDRTDPESIASCESDCIELLKKQSPVIVIVENDMAYNQIFNNTSFLGKRSPVLTLKEMQILIQALFYTQNKTISQGGSPINFRQLLQGLDRQFQHWELPITQQEAQQIMIRMGLRPQPPQEDQSVFGPQGSHHHIANKNASEIKVGIVGLGDRGVGMLRRFVDTNPHTQPKNQRFMEVVAVCDRDPKAIKKAWKKSGMKKLPKSVHPRIYHRFEDFLRDEEVNMVNIAVPSGIDEQMAQQLSLAGKAPQLIVKDNDPRARRPMRR